MNVGRHTAFNLFGSTLPMLVSLLTVPLFFKYIGSERYGLLAVIWALLGYFGFFDLGFGRALSNRMARLSEATASDRSDLLWTALACTFGLGILGSIVLWLLADFILAKTVAMPASFLLETESSAKWLLFAMPVVLPISVLQGALQARLRFFELNAIQIAGTTLGQVLPLLVAAGGYTRLEYLVPAALASRAITFVLLFAVCRRAIPLAGAPIVVGSHLKPLASYGGWITLVGMLGPLLVTIDRVVIASVSGAKAVAQYTVPYDLVSRSMVISNSFSSALFPRLASSSSEQASAMAKQATQSLVAVMTPVAVVGLFIAQPFLRMWVGESFARDSSGVAELIMCGVWINALAIPYNTLLLSSENPKQIVLIYLVEIPVYFAILWIGINSWGVVGAASAWTLRVALDTTLLLWVSGGFLATMRDLASSIGLIAVATTVSLSGDGLLMSRPVLGLGLFSASLYLHRHQFRKIARHLSHRPA
jgi:O-antigen/teichoic acid export membrane protein